MNSRLCLGTAQFGLEYGISNQSGRPTVKDVAEILTLAQGRGLSMLDTAISYGESETVLGQAGCEGFEVITKLPPVPAHVSSVADWVEDSVAQSLGKLRLDVLYAVLLHRPLDLLGHSSQDFLLGLERVRQSGKANKIGISIYAPTDLDAVWDVMVPDIVQAPLNLVDRRLVDSGWLYRLSENGVEVHTRSAFLQGLLLMARGDIPQHFAKWAPMWDRWHEELVASGGSAVLECLRFPLSFPEVDRVVVGVESTAQLQQLLMADTSSNPQRWNFMRSEDETLINPSQWRAS